MAAEPDSPSGLAAAASVVEQVVSRLAAALPFAEPPDEETLSPDEAIRRAHALGVAAAFGADTEAALAEVRSSLDATYDRSIVDLAYREGKGDADAYGSSGPDAPRDEGSRDGPAGDADRPGAPGSGAASARDGAPTPAGTRTTATELPAVLERTGLLDGGADAGALDFPEGLGDPTENEGSNP